jgi:hypothetical protein
VVAAKVVLAVVAVAEVEVEVEVVEAADRDGVANGTRTERHE